MLIIGQTICAAPRNRSSPMPTGRHSKPRQVAKATVHRHARRAVEQTRGAALGRGMLRHELGREREVEVAEGVGTGHEGRIVPWPTP